MRITKIKANQIAKELLKNKKEELKKGIEELEFIVQNKWRDALPEYLVKCFLKHQSFFHSTSYNTNIRIDDTPRCKYFVLKPATINSGIRHASDFDQEVIQKNNELLNLAIKIEKSQVELTEYIYKLGTPEKIKNQFPEADVSVTPKQVTIITPDLLSWLKN